MCFLQSLIGQLLKSIISLDNKLIGALKMTNEKEYIVSFLFTDQLGANQTAKVKVTATSDADAIRKAKKETSVDKEGSNYQVIPGASVSQT